VFLLLDSTETHAAAQRRRRTFTMSLLTHGLLVAAILVLPLLADPALPEVGNAVRAFFVQPSDIAPPPPPPPPPAPGAARTLRAAPPKVAETPAAFVAPIEVPDLVKPEEGGLDLGMEGGVPGGVEGGVPGGVVGGVVGGLPAELPPPPKKVVRVGGNIIAPKLVKKVDPVYPPLAAQSRVQAMVILEAEVDTRGNVTHVTVLRGSPLFDDAAIAAVKQWRYQPLLLNGVPTDFILTVTVMFRLATPVPQG